jgi:hypothetical protein
MSQKQINPGLLSSMRGAELFAFAFRIDGTNDPDILVQLGANAVESVVRDSAGTFIVQFNQAYPRQVLVFPTLAQATATATVEDVRYVLDSYDASTGQLTIETITDDGDGTLTVEDITDNSMVYVLVISQTVNGLVEDES